VAVARKLKEAEELLTIIEVSKLAKVSPDTVRRAIKAEQLGHVSLLNSNIRITTSQYNDWIRRSTSDAKY
jgi:DNA-binding transcriptional regulator YhcF (GntR family)